MAKPIEPLPVVEGKDAERFLNDLSRPQDITQRVKKFFNGVKELK